MSFGFKLTYTENQGGISKLVKRKVIEVLEILLGKELSSQFSFILRLESFAWMRGFQIWSQS